MVAADHPATARGEQAPAAQGEHLAAAAAAAVDGMDAVAVRGQLAATQRRGGGALSGSRVLNRGPSFYRCTAATFTSWKLPVTLSVLMSFKRRICAHTT